MANKPFATIRNLDDGRYEMHCSKCGISVIPDLPCTMDKFLKILNEFNKEHKHAEGEEEAVL